MRISKWLLAGVLALVLAVLTLFWVRASVQSVASAQAFRDASALAQNRQYTEGQPDSAPIDLGEPSVAERSDDSVRPTDAPTAVGTSFDPFVDRPSAGRSGTMGSGGEAGGMMPGGNLAGRGAMMGMPAGAASPGMAPALDRELDILVKQEAALGQQVDATLAAYAAAEQPGIRESLKKQLANWLAQQFSLQRQRRELELARIESRLKKMRERLDRRNQSEQTIIQRRMEQLLSEADGLGWSSLDGAASENRTPLPVIGDGLPQDPNLLLPQTPSGLDAAVEGGIPEAGVGGASPAPLEATLPAADSDPNAERNLDELDGAGEAPRGRRDSVPIETPAPSGEGATSESGNPQIPLLPPPGGTDAVPVISDGATLQPGDHARENGDIVTDVSESVVADGTLRQAGEAQRDLEAQVTAELQGTWLVSRSVIDDVVQGLPEQVETWTFRDHKFQASLRNPEGAAQRENQPVNGANFFLNPARDPAELTIAGENLLIQAIYELREDTLAVAFFSRPEIARPAGFTIATASKAGGGPINSHLNVWTFQRQKADDAR